MAHIDDYSDYLDETEQACREVKDITDRVRILEREFAFLDAENSDLWEIVLDQQAEINQLQYALLHDLVHEPEFEVEVITNIEDLEDAINGRPLVVPNDESEEEECNCWRTSDAECVAHMFGGVCYYDREEVTSETAGGDE